VRLNPRLDTCPNCAHPLGPGAESFAFCPACGQELRIGTPRVGEWLQQWGGAYVSTEGALWRTLRLLITQPGELTRRYLAGQRKHFVQPLRLYMSLSVLLLLLAGLSSVVNPLSGSENPALLVAASKPLPSLVIRVAGLEVGLREGRRVCTGLPTPLCDEVGQRIRREPAAFLERLRHVNALVVARWGLVMFVLMPLFALCVNAVYANRRLTYGAHLVYVLHLHAFWALMLLFTLPGWTPLTATALVVMALYTLLAGRRVYGGRWWARLLRASLLALLYAAMLAVAVPASFVLALLL
jgi:hypothetical protein